MGSQPLWSLLELSLSTAHASEADTNAVETSQMAEDGRRRTRRRKILTPEQEEIIRIFVALLIVFGLIWFSLRVDDWRIRRMIRNEVKAQIQKQKVKKKP